MSQNLSIDTHWNYSSCNVLYNIFTYNFKCSRQVYLRNCMKAWNFIWHTNCQISKALPVLTLAKCKCYSVPNNCVWKCFIKFFPMFWVHCFEMNVQTGLWFECPTFCQNRPFFMYGYIFLAKKRQIEKCRRVLVELLLSHFRS